MIEVVGRDDGTSEGRCDSIVSGNGASKKKKVRLFKEPEMDINIENMGKNSLQLSPGGR